jgi:lipid II isoglutaminyl synthase (glutamine-hydrolysing)
VTNMKISVGYLYPDVMSTYGDRGNIEAIVRRCRWRDIGVAVTELRAGDKVVPREFDLIMIGGGGESRQQQIAPDLYKVKGGGIREAVAAGTAVLAVGGGYELFGRFCESAKGPELRGIELFDSWTIRKCGDRHDHDESTGWSCADRIAGDLIARWDGRLLVGFESHCGRTYLGPGAHPLARVVSGRGNNGGDGSEGILLGAAIGTNLRGPCLPANPALADFLISAALSHRYGAAEPAAPPPPTAPTPPTAPMLTPLTPLVDDLELAARGATIRRTVLTGRGRGLTWGLRRQTGQPGRRRGAARSRLRLGGRAGVRR